MKHLKREEFIEVFSQGSEKSRKRTLYNRIYNKIVEKWESPEDWFSDENKTIHIDNLTSDSYWVIWSMTFEISLPIEFIKNLSQNNSLLFLKRHLKDYTRFEEACNKLCVIFTKAYIVPLYSIIIRLCLYLGVNSIQKISVEDIAKAYSLGLLKHDGYRMKMSNLLYYMSYIDAPCRDHKLYSTINTLELSDSWSDSMKSVISRHINNLYNTTISCRKMECEKKNGLNLFAEWYVNKYGTDVIDDFFFINKEVYKDYIIHIRSLEDISGKSKQAKIFAVKDFLNWVKIKEPQLLLESNSFNTEEIEYCIEHYQEENLAFEEREHGEKIIRYLLNDFKAKNIRDEFRKEAIIIAANSGARISEIRRFPFGSCFYSKDEGLYKILNVQTDKLNQKNRPIYFTKEGYDAIKRVEELRVKNDVLKEKRSDRGDGKYIHLFEYQGSCPINHTSMDDFISRIKKEIGLVDGDGKVVKGGMHAWRHFFAVTLFIEGDYNSSVVRYFLGHKDYDMSYQYIKSSNKLLNQRISNEMQHEKERYAGKGVETMVDLVISNRKSKEKFDKELIKQSKGISDLIKEKIIKKVGFGYCLNPCDNSVRCIRCKNFLISNQDADKIIEACIELFEILCVKVSQFDSVDMALKQTSIQKNMADIMVLIGEMRRLKINTNKLPSYLEGIINDEC
ncbi:MAG TPA: site-specific integrase [Clostridia bacterium]|nr:site-specific integrase [Clostridia bacterium]